LLFDGNMADEHFPYGCGQYKMLNNLKH